MSRISSPKPRATYHHGDLRAELLGAASQVIADTGTASFSMRELAKMAGVAHGAMYVHFANKRAILETLAVEGLADLNRRQLDAIAGVAHPLARLVGLANAYLDFARSTPGVYRLIFSSDLERLETAPVSGARSSAAQLMLQEIERAQAEKLIIDEDRQILAIVLWGSMHGLAHLLISDHIDEMPIAARRKKLTIQLSIKSAVSGILTAKGRRAFITVAAIT